MHRYPELSNPQNILVECADGGDIDTETVMSLLDLAESTASNYLRGLYGRGYLKRKNVHAHTKSGGPRYQYALTSEGRKKVVWIKTKILKQPA